MYAHLKDGGIDCCGDFTMRSEALAYGEELASIHGWPFHDYSSNPCKNNNDFILRAGLATKGALLGLGHSEAPEPPDENTETDGSAAYPAHPAPAAGAWEIYPRTNRTARRTPPKGGVANG